jgi:hypothetical protein
MVPSGRPEIQLRRLKYVEVEVRLLLSCRFWSMECRIFS